MMRKSFALLAMCLLAAVFLAQAQTLTQTQTITTSDGKKVEATITMNGDIITATSPGEEASRRSATGCEAGTRDTAPFRPLIL